MKLQARRLQPGPATPCKLSMQNAKLILRHCQQVPYQEARNRIFQGNEKCGIPPGPSRPAQAAQRPAYRRDQQCAKSPSDSSGCCNCSLTRPLLLSPGKQQVALASHLIDDQVLALRGRDQGEVVAMAADVLRHLVHLGLCAIAAQSAPESAAESASMEQAHRLIAASNKCHWRCLRACVALPDQESSSTLSSSCKTGDPLVHRSALAQSGVECNPRAGSWPSLITRELRPC